VQNGYIVIPENVQHIKKPKTAMPNPTVFNENFADIKFFCLHKWGKKSKVINFLVTSKLSGRTRCFNDEIGFY